MRLEKVNFRINDMFSLQDIDFSINAGENLVLLGNTVAGKTLLINIIAGVYTPTSGNLYLDGKRIHFTSPAEALEHGIFALYETSTLFDNFSVAENIYLTQLASRKDKHFSLFVNKKKLHATCEDLFATLEINLSASAKVNSLTMFQKRIVEMVKIYLQKPRILLIDGISDIPSAEDEQQFLSLLNRIRNESQPAILYATTELNTFYKDCRNVIVMHDGRITKTLHPETAPDPMALHDFLRIRNAYPKLTQMPGMRVFQLEDFSVDNAFLHVNINLRKRQILGVYGVSDLQYDYLMQVLLGLRGDYTGTIRLRDKPVSIQSPNHAIRLGLACSPINRCEDGLFGNLNLRMNLMPPIRELPWGQRPFISHSTEQTFTNDSIRRLHINMADIHAQVSSASNGTQQKILLSRWLSTNADIYLLYNPTAGLDVPSKSDIYNIMNQLLIRGASILLFSNDIDELLSMSDEIAIFKNGAVSGLLSSRDPTLETKFFALLDRTVR